MKREDLIFAFVKCLGLYVTATALPGFITGSVLAWLYFTHPSPQNTAVAPLLYSIQGPLLSALGLIIGFQLLFNTTAMSNWIQRNDKKS